jgi:hypothetical protein
MVRGLLASWIKALNLLIVLWVIILFVNFPIISFDMVYFEQPILYLVNQKIHSLHDLLQLYFQPKMLDIFFVPFFRPSGHFLVYQIITPLLGWHNTKGFLAVNFLFLALTCYFIIKIYSQLFSRYAVGGYIACGIYLMHPALMLPKLTPMHFEFASVFFALLALYFFIGYCKKNLDRPVSNKTQFKNSYLLVLCVLAFFVSVTFKEVAVMLGPVMVIYLGINLYNSQPGYFSGLLRNAQLKQIIGLLTILTLVFATYMSMAWSTLVRPQLTFAIAASLVKLLTIIFGFLPKHVGHSSASIDVLLYRTVLITNLSQWLLWVSCALMAMSIYNIYYVRWQDNDILLSHYRKSFLFLMIATFAFMFMPVMWGKVFPWHLALSLVFFSLMLGFGFEYFCQLIFRNAIWVRVASVAFVIALGISTILVGETNTDFFQQDLLGFALKVNHNAVFKAPAIKNQLNNESVVIVENGVLGNEYLLGDSIYPFEIYADGLDRHRLIPAKGSYDYPYVYGGTLFRWAYLMPKLQEQVYPFTIDKMRDVPTVTIYNWLLHFDNIFCLGYDENANWHDKTVAFKKVLLIEKARRHLVVNQYNVISVQNAHMNLVKEVRSFTVDVRYCKFLCDKNINCKGFGYLENNNNSAECYFAGAVTRNKKSECSACKVFIKV